MRLAEHALTAAGELELKQSRWGIRPVSVAGVVKVKNELRVEWTVVALPVAAAGEPPTR